ncbi:MAG: serine/threonine-protein kinase HipA, partial [Arcobacteraceae bacterium]
MHQLTVYYNKDKVGILALLPQSEEFTFHYDDEWQKHGFSLSPEISLNNNFSNICVKNFIANLLPEGDGLEKLSEYLHISKSHKYALIRELGSETSGALIFTDGRTLEDTRFREIPLSELTERIKKRKEISIDVWEGKPRLSVAGIQEKLPVAIINGIYGLADGDLASTHLLKFDKQVSTNLIINEYLSMKLARYGGLDVANCEIKDFGGELVLEVERFDRKLINENQVERKFVIDGCQVLCVPVSYKYERNFGSGRDVKDIREGMSFKKLFLITTKCKVPLIAKKNIMEWILINLCLGNSDAHGKKISFFKNNDGMFITPFYDIVNVNMYKEQYDHSLAMAISDEFDLDKLKANDFLEFCNDHEIQMKQFVSMFNTISNKIIQGF